MGPRHRLREDILLDALLASRPGRRVLNVGAGQGTLTNRLVDVGFDVTSCDLSAAAVEILRTRARGTVVQADATDLPFGGEEFDVVILAEVIEHIEDDGAAIREAKRVVAPGGLLMVTVPRNPAWFARSDEWAGHVRRYTRERLVRVVSDGGFEVVKCTAWGFPMSSLYHRTAYEVFVRRRGGDTSGAAARSGLPLLGAVLRLDRLFVGVERGALGYVLVGRSRAGDSLTSA